MMTCMFWKRAFVIRFLVVLVLMSVFGGTNALYVIRSDVDAFSNPDAASCSRVGCRRVRGANGCKRGNCCMCQCSRSRPNYLSHRKACVPNDELIGDCDFLPLSSEIAVVDFSKAGIVLFYGDADRCYSGLRVAQWSYRLDTPKMIKEQPNNFIVKGGGSSRWYLQVRKK
ncbi:uncharacterized skeletal organic matrix protein 3-like [Orbicella faveolata]|uniref:uncharacterized skeletal organic matrix protein 3-like n=1 Tax=Orbicella faveolata TaxID=48498 RepID=UPI0009E2BA07|nr:uncharacterized skeletal organic matrix protein 3-like [Orbicella faveolata]